MAAEQHLVLWHKGSCVPLASPVQDCYGIEEATLAEPVAPSERVFQWNVFTRFVGWDSVPTQRYRLSWSGQSPNLPFEDKHNDLFEGEGVLACPRPSESGPECQKDSRPRSGNEPQGDSPGYC